MKFCEYQPGKFVNPQFIIRISIDCDERSGIEHLFRPDELRRRMIVVLEIKGDAAPARVADACLDKVIELFPAVETRMRELERAIIKAHVISAFCRFPLAA